MLRQIQHIQAFLKVLLFTQGWEESGEGSHQEAVAAINQTDVL